MTNSDTSLAITRPSTRVAVLICASSTFVSEQAGQDFLSNRLFRWDQEHRQNGALYALLHRVAMLLGFLAGRFKNACHALQHSGGIRGFCVRIGGIRFVRRSAIVTAQARSDLPVLAAAFLSCRVRYSVTRSLVISMALSGPENSRR